MACTQARISYNLAKHLGAYELLWLALMHGSVTIALNGTIRLLALWLALMHGSVTIPSYSLATSVCCGLHSCTDQLQFACSFVATEGVVACTHARISYNIITTIG